MTHHVALGQSSSAVITTKSLFPPAEVFKPSPLRPSLKFQA